MNSTKILLKTFCQREATITFIIGLYKNVINLAIIFTVNYILLKLIIKSCTIILNSK